MPLLWNGKGPPCRLRYIMPAYGTGSIGRRSLAFPTGYGDIDTKNEDGDGDGIRPDDSGLNFPAGWSKICGYGPQMPDFEPPKGHFRFLSQAAAGQDGLTLFSP